MHKNVPYGIVHYTKKLNFLINVVTLEFVICFEAYKQHG